nr:Spo0B domain-containing protein [uncultured Acetatifactor sp.]
MLRLGVWLIWLALYQYYIEQICDLGKGKIKRIAVWGITGGTALAVGIVSLVMSGLSRPVGKWLILAGWLLIMLVLFLYVLFYDAAPLCQQWWKALAPGFVLVPGAFAENPVSIVLANGAITVFFLLMPAYASGRKDFYAKGASLADIAVYGIISLYLWKIRETADTGMLLGFLAVELLLFLSLEGTFSAYRQGFQVQTERFQRDILSHQYEEVKEIYLNMRGWRHDYHNHLQVMKAQIAAGQMEEMKGYLDELEQSLEDVDTFVKSGNLMADAILNSKLSLAEKRESL